MALVKDYKMLTHRLSNRKQQLVADKQKPSLDTSIRQKMETLAEFDKSRVKLCSLVGAQVLNTAATYKKRVDQMFETLKSDANFREMELTLYNASESLKRLKQDIDDGKKSQRELKVLAKKYFNDVETFKTNYAGREDILSIFEQDIDEDSGELETTLAELEARAITINEVDPQILVEYNTRAKEIEAAEIQINQLESSLHTRTESFEKDLEDWKQNVKSIVEKINQSFSDYFSRIGCVGEVRLQEQPLVSKYGIEIWVKFRDIEQLQILDSHRQSGGERSVSTMIYLISLQSLSKSPFRVVDEINQGMDPRNERIVHRLIVESACEKYNSQYFLITPKLLPDLMYHDKLRVLCIFNGVWQPENLTVAA